MNIKKRIHLNVNKFMLDTSASMVIMFGAAMPVVLTVGGVGIDMLSVQIQDNSTSSKMESVGSFASANNSCTGQSGGTLSACAGKLQTLVSSYAEKIDPNIVVTVTPGLWCNSAFVLNGSCSSNNSVGAIKVVSTTSYDTKFLRLFGKSNISKTIEMILINSGQMTSIKSAGICPGIILNEKILSDSQAGDVLWSTKNQSPRNLSLQELKVNNGQNSSFTGETGALITANPFWIYDETNQMTSFPTRETISANSRVPIAALTGPSGSDVDLTAQRSVNVWSNIYQASPGSFGKKVDDRDLPGQSIDSSDNGGTQVLRALKKLEGKTCMALVGEETGNSGKVKIMGAIAISMDTVCDGKRKRVSSQWVALQIDGATTESRCSYSSSTDRTDISLKFRWGEDRYSDAAAFTISDSAKWGGTNKGDSSKGGVIAMRSPPTKAADNRSFR